MNHARKGLRHLTLLATLVLGIAAAAPASALSMSVYLAPISQDGTTAYVKLGHIVSATTNYNRLTAGGTFDASCLVPNTGSIIGSNSLSSNGLTGPRSVNAHVPNPVPSSRLLPGFNSVAYGTTLNCIYRYTAYAVEGNFTIGVGGTGTVVGGDEQRISNQINFTMIRPEEKQRGCILD